MAFGNTDDLPLFWVSAASTSLEMDSLIPTLLLFSAVVIQKCIHAVQKPFSAYSLCLIKSTDKGNLFALEYLFFKRAIFHGNVSVSVKIFRMEFLVGVRKSSASK